MTLASLAQDKQRIARNAQALLKGGRDATRVDSGSVGTACQLRSDSESTSKKTKGNAQRKWGESASSETEMASFDFNIDEPASGTNDHLSHNLQALVDKACLDDDANGTISRVLKNEGAKQLSGSLSALSSLFSRLTGSKVLTEQDFRPVLEGMKLHLMKTNVAMEIAHKICEGVGGSSVVFAHVYSDAQDLKRPAIHHLYGCEWCRKEHPMSKVCFWLTQNGLRVSIAACDTVRTDAVKQLRVHVRNLSMLGVNDTTNSKGCPLIRALAKLVAANNSDKIIFVGEALVDNEVID
ncbi:hypothetical protein EDB19DRAFT_1915831 [Suillus lakei]|nr:hypothetical protein EDB19DRAFT_1915831 [Suillus lakei]